MKNHNHKAVKAELEKQPNILITTHRGPDGDAMGSSLALYQVLKTLGHKVSVVVPNSYAEFWKSSLVAPPSYNSLLYLI